MRTWRLAWQEALYGERGFYRRAPGPAGHFATSCHGALGEHFAEAVLRLAAREGLATIVDVGAGRGELLRAMSERLPGSARGGGAGEPVPDGAAGGPVRLIGVDVVHPGSLPDGVDWVVTAGGPEPPDLRGLGPALVIANEWLDVIPCPIAETGADGLLREVLVAPDGTERLGDPVGCEDLAWAQRWWPAEEPGTRVEIGRTRDEALATLLARVDAGRVVAIDYGHTAADRPASGTLTGYRSGIQVPPQPDGGCDLTAHVAVDSLPQDRRLSQRDALGELGLRGQGVPDEMARSDPSAYLSALSRAAAAGALRGPGLGDFWWIVNRVP